MEHRREEKVFRMEERTVMEKKLKKIQTLLRGGSTHTGCPKTRKEKLLTGNVATLEQGETFIHEEPERSVSVSQVALCR